MWTDLEARVPAQHPLRAIREIVNASLAELSAEFQALYSHTGRPGIAPEKLLRALLSQAFYSIRSERRLMAEVEFNLLYRCFVGLGIDDAGWDATVFCKNRDRLLAGDVAARFLATLLAKPRVKLLLSAEHSSVDGTLIEAWASIKSFGSRLARQLVRTLLYCLIRLVSTTWRRYSGRFAYGDASLSGLLGRVARHLPNRLGAAPSGLLIAAEPSCISSMRRISTEGGAARISLKACIHSPVLSSLPPIPDAGIGRADQGP